MKKSASPKSTKSVSVKPKSRKSKKDSKSTKIAGANLAPVSAVPAGGRIGTKRSDLRFRAPDGSEWASPFEYKVFAALTEQGVEVRKTDTIDAIKYTSPVKNGRAVCPGICSEVVQDRVYTPDLLFTTDTPRLVYLETKGYFPGPKRNLFKQARSQHPELDIRLVASTDHWVTKGKTRLSDWAKRFRIPFHVWNGSLPQEWLV